MRASLSSAFRIAAGLVLVLFPGCGRSPSAGILDASVLAGTGGSIIAAGGASGTTSQPATDGAPASGGTEAGGAQGGGGGVGTGGQSGTGGRWGSGGATGTGGLGLGGSFATGGGPAVGGHSSFGGAMVGSGGRSGGGGGVGTGGTTVGSGGRSGSGGAAGTGGTTVGSGGRSSSGGMTGPGGSSATGGRSSDGGATGTGGGSGTGGTTGTGGATGSGGATGTPAFPPKFVGNIDARSSIRSDFATHWDQFTPENAGKWPSVQGASSSTYNWSALDALYKYCDDHGIVFKEHCFIWGAGQPAWLSNLDTTTGPAAVKNWMKSFCDRYPKTRIIDVVNEPPPHTTPTYANAIGGGTNTTWDWIANSFKWAREVCPDAILILNDYNNIEYASDIQHTIDIVTAIQKLGAPIDAIGCQTHYANGLSASTLQANIDNLVSATGLPVYITEYDIGLADDEEQKQQYQEHIPMFWENANVKGITLWGYIVGYTWRSNTGIMQSDGTMRPAMAWLMEFLGR